MSQGDYIKFKKTGVQLQSLYGLDPSANHMASYSNYDAFTGYNIETTTPNLSVNYGKQTVPSNVIQVFGMKIGNASVGCPSFACVGRNSIPAPPPPDNGGGGGEGGGGEDEG